MTREEKIICKVFLNDADKTHSCNEYKLLMALLEQEPCEDAVSRQAVIETIFVQGSVEKLEIDFAKLLLLQRAIKALPSVIPQQKTGHWIYDNFNWRCSECNETPKTMGYVGTADFMTEHFKFCNHCGAKMIEPQESEDKNCI